MWCLQHRKEFCNTPEEWHAICCGWFFPTAIWWPIAQYQTGKAADLLRNEPWYVAFGTFLQRITFIVIGVLAFVVVAVTLWLLGVI